MITPLTMNSKMNYRLIIERLQLFNKKGKGATTARTAVTYRPD